MNARLVRFIYRVLSVTAIIVGFVSIFVTNNILNSKHMLTIIIIDIFIIILYFIFQKIRKNVKSKLGKVEITISKGDLLQKKGFLVIPFEEEFILQVDDSKISKNSLQGKFITKIYNSEIELVNIENYSSKLYIENEKKILLFPLCKLDNNMARLERKEFVKKLLELWELIDAYSNECEIYVPLIGTGQLRVSPELSEELALKLILDSIEVYGFEINKKINIILYDTNININKVRSTNEL